MSPSPPDAPGSDAPSGGRPNVLVIFSDQQRWDTLGAYRSPMSLTPNLDAMAARGVRFETAITPQPVCAPARGCLITGQHATTHGVWKNGLGLTAAEHTLPSCFRRAGYQVGYIGKWHLAPHEAGRGPVPPEYRAGFDDFWEASNTIEIVSHPYETVLYDREGNELRPSGYRVDALTDRAIRFLKELRREPFFLMISYLEPHQQNDWNRFVAPDGYAARYANPFVPEDLRAFPGDWLSQLPDYYGCIARIDECIGRLFAVLAEEGLMANTIVAFFSDHGCHFRTRNGEYKRSCHDASVRVPLLFQGPGFDRRLVIPEIASLVDVAPTLLDAANLPIPHTMQGQSLMPLVRRKSEGWRNEAFIQISESCVGRALRTERWTYAVTAPGKHGGRHPSSDVYVETHLYDNFADPHQLTNLVGRREYRSVAAELRERLVVRMVEIGEKEPEIQEAPWYAT